MTGPTRRLKVNRVLEGKECALCQGVLAFGEDAAVCGVCEAPHHASCWDQKGGCGTPDCENAPLRQLEGTAATAMPPGKVACPSCGTAVDIRASRCPVCRAAMAPVRHRRASNRRMSGTAPGATASLVLGILSLVVCGPILGTIAIVKANEAQRAIAHNPELEGAGMATSGKVLGIIGIAIAVLYIAIKVGGR